MKGLDCWSSRLNSRKNSLFFPQLRVFEMKNLLVGNVSSFPFPLVNVASVQRGWVMERGWPVIQTRGPSSAGLIHGHSLADAFPRTFPSWECDLSPPLNTSLTYLRGAIFFHGSMHFNLGKSSVVVHLNGDIQNECKNKYPAKRQITHKE